MIAPPVIVDDSRSSVEKCVESVASTRILPFTPLLTVSPLSTRVLSPATSIVPSLVSDAGSIVSVPLATTILLALKIAAPVIKLMPVESITPKTLSVPPLVVAPLNASVLPPSTWIVLLVSRPVKNVPFTVTLSSVSFTSPSIVTPPLSRMALTVPVPLMELSPITSIMPPAPAAKPSMMVPPLIVTCDSISVLPSSTWMMLLVSTSVKIVPLTMTLSSVSVTSLSTVTPPLLRTALAVVVPLMELLSTTSIVPPAPSKVPSMMAPPLMATCDSVNVSPSSIVRLLLFVTVT
ncbi:hypothetical protein GALL_527230 [mine drainage metagenome]|uniref:Uncharacterized protein n=1 Tax=mine drainage metagenome TaxID=410659 RepID=A0A1J5PK93_9ZZZZ